MGASSVPAVQAAETSAVAPIMTSTASPAAQEDGDYIPEDIDAAEDEEEDEEEDEDDQEELLLPEV